jgi:hypothetical protein
VLRRIAAKIAVAVETIVSVERFDLARCRTTAPSTAPTPKKPSRKPYPTALLLSSLATAGRRAEKELAKKITIPDRSSSVRMPGE